MKKLLPLLVLAMTMFVSCAEKIEKTDLKVLYVSGSSDWMHGESANTLRDADSVASRAAAFEALLNEYFTSVTVLPDKEYKPEISASYDVTIIDGKTPVIRKTVFQDDDYMDRAFLPNDFNYPTMLLAEAGDLYGRSLGTKTDWFCLCLAGDAYNVNTEHPIFNTPYNVELTFEEKPTPEEAFSYQAYFNEPIPATQKMWKVNTLDYNNTNSFRIGMVCRPWGYLDSPETEVISGGVSAKSPDAVAISRHGNFFHWGFAASPKYMTEEAKVVFINAVVYTSTLKGEKIIARKYKVGNTKDNIIFKMNSVSDDNYQKYVAAMDRAYKARLEMVARIKEKAAKGETLTDDEKMYLNMPVNKNTISKEDYIKKMMGKLYKKFNGNVEEYVKYYKDNEPYLYAERYDFVLDEEAKALKIANTDKQLLNKAIELLEKDSKSKEGLAILDRYTNCTFETPKQWREWYNRVEEKLFFSQAGGWKWLVDTDDPTEPANDYDAKAIKAAAKTIKLAKTTTSQPVASGATVCKLQGGRQCVVVKINVHDGYHIYGPVSGNNAFNPTSLALSMPEGYTADPVKFPAAQMTAGGVAEYTGEVVLSQPIYGTDGDKIVATLEYQCCNEGACLVPAEVTFELAPIFKAYRR